MLEIIANTVEDAINIEQGGGDRIELVSALSEGGLTASYGLIKQVLEAVKIPVNVMIRPHSNSFVYSEGDLQVMLEDIEQAKALGANGIVLGMLDPDGNIALEQLNGVLGHCQGLEVTFHRAIDETKDILASTRLLAKTSITRVLSSGGPGNAEDNLVVLREMRNILDGAGMFLLAGSSVNADNCQAILQATGADELHVGTGVRPGRPPFAGVGLQAVERMAKAYRQAVARL